MAREVDAEPGVAEMRCDPRVIGRQAQAGEVGVVRVGPDRESGARHLDALDRFGDGRVMGVCDQYRVTERVRAGRARAAVASGGGGQRCALDTRDAAPGPMVQPVRLRPDAPGPDGRGRRIEDHLDVTAGETAVCALDGVEIGLRVVGDRRREARCSETPRAFGVVAAVCGPQPFHVTLQPLRCRRGEALASAPGPSRSTRVCRAGLSGA
jgi:hypothetical protein